MGMADVYGQRMQAMSHPWTNVSGPIIRMGSKEVTLQDLVNERNKVVAYLCSERDLLQVKLDRAERALKRAGYQDLGGQEWKPPLGKAPRFDLTEQSIRNAWLDAEVVGNSWDGAKAVLDLINKKEISTGKAFQMEPGTMTQDKALDTVISHVIGLPLSDMEPPTDQVEALARVLEDATAEGFGEEHRTYMRRLARVAIAHLSKRPEVSTKPVDLWSIITSITDIRVDCDGCDYVEIDRTSVSDLEVALSPWLRDPVEFELDVTADEIVKAIVHDHRDTLKIAQAVLDLCRSRISPTYECKECAARREDMMRPQQEIRCAGCEEWERKYRDMNRWHDDLDAKLCAVRAALEGE